MQRKDIKNFSLPALKKEITDLEEPVYRAEQIFSWLYKKAADDFDGMENLPKPLRDKLNLNYYIGGVKLFKHLKSKDGTEKFIFELYDGNLIETVLIKSKVRKTVCLSTQVGCKFGCAFCASGLKKFVRNLSPSEIINQILFLRFNFNHSITNYVFMGMGEPLDNYENVVKAIKIMNDDKGIGAGSRKITISTCGLIEGIEKLSKLGMQVNLSVSLHAADDKLRNELVPANKKHGLEKIIRACEKFKDKTGREITLEYILIKDKNDSPEDANELAEIAKRLNAKVNLIPYSFVQGFHFKPPVREEVEKFCNKLLSRKIKATIRRSKGSDIQAACGQLAGKYRK
ncbi:MAG: 23S rRNA (adenine(2503)-C(2))-methyltransferase RlmN [Candidatus Omnitrophota bacterium]